MAKRLVTKKEANKAAGVVKTYSVQQARIAAKKGAKSAKKGARIVAKKTKVIAKDAFKGLKKLFNK